MNEIKIIGKINELLYTATDLCCGWLNKMLPRISDSWWANCVLDSLSFNQNQLAQEKGYTELKQLDLAALLRVIDKNWYAMRNFAYLPTKDRETVHRMMRVRNKTREAGFACRPSFFILMTTFAYYDIDSFSI